MAAKKKAKAKAKADAAAKAKAGAAALAFPKDNAGWQVYCDALQTKGDPRGEVMAIQLALANGGGFGNLPKVPIPRRRTTPSFAPLSRERWRRSSRAN